MQNKNHALLAVSIVLVASLIAVAIPTVVPVLAASNSHIVVINPNTSQAALNQTSFVSVNGTALPGITLTCAIGLIPTSQGGNSSIIYYTVDLGSCHPVNG